LGLATRDLVWQGRVLLDPVDIPKAMWAEDSPDGSLIWTSSGADLLAYRTADVQLTAGDTPIRPVRRVAGAVPPSGITGATFVGDRLLVAGQEAGPFQVWSIDLATGARRLENERPWAGESEGLATVDALGGQLQWQIQSLDPQGRPPTFGTGHGTIVSFVSASNAPIALRVGARVRVARG
jgi:outer membrane protein assembly factor BamB